MFGRISNQPVVATNVPVLRDGRASHVLGLAYASDFYVQLLQAQLTGREHIGAILDGTGRVVARSRGADRFVGRIGPPPFAHGTQALPSEGIGETINLDGQASYYAFSRSRVNDWVASVGIPKATLLAPPATRCGCPRRSCWPCWPWAGLWHCACRAASRGR